MTQLTVEVLQEVTPAKLKNTITQSLVDKINNLSADPHLAEIYRENILSYIGVLKTGKYKIDDYINAIKYVSHRMMNDSQKDAYIKTFPDRYQQHLMNGTSAKDIASYITAYAKNKLVNEIWEQSQTPFHLLNVDKRQQALNHLVHLMLSANSEKVQADSANMILNHTAPPTKANVEVNIGIGSNDALEQLRIATDNLVKVQRSALENGSMGIKDITNQVIVRTVDD